MNFVVRLDHEKNRSSKYDSPPSLSVSPSPFLSVFKLGKPSLFLANKLTLEPSILANMCSLNYHFGALDLRQKSG